MKNIKYVIFIIYISMLPLISTDIYLPAFVSIRKYFFTSISLVENTVTIYLIGLAIGQLIYGYISDIYGRKKILLIGLLIYSLATLMCIFSTNIYEMLFFRLLQSIGACSGLIIGRAIIADRFSGKDYFKMFATVYPVVGLSPAIAPVIGGYLTNIFGWKSNFILLLLLALIAILMTMNFEESLNEEKRLNNLDLKLIIENNILVLKNVHFLYYASMISLAYAAHFAYISGSPFVLDKFNYSTEISGYFYGLLSFSYLAGNFICKKLIDSHDINFCLNIGRIIFVIGGSIFLIISLNNPSNPWFYIVSMSIITGANGFLIPMGAAGSTNQFTNMKGTASGMMGFLQLLSATIGSLVVSIFVNGNAILLAIIIFFITTFPLLVNYIYKRRIIAND